MPRTRNLGTKPPIVSAISAGAMVFVFVGLILAALLWVPSMQAGLAARAAATQPHIAIEWPLAATDPSDRTGVPKSWVPMPVRDELLALACREVERHNDPFSPAGLRSVSDVLMRTGWFEAVTSVRREHDAITVKADWRTPAAVVRRNGVDYLIAHAGHLLPVSYQRGQAPVTAIVGAAHEPPMVAGQLAPGLVWEGGDIKAALDTIATISTRPWHTQVTAIDVSDYPLKKKLALVTKWNGRAVIGGGPRDMTPGEVAIDMKLKRLDELVRQFGQIDAKHRLVEVAGPVILVDDVSASAQLP